MNLEDERRRWRAIPKMPDEAALIEAIWSDNEPDVVVALAKLATGQPLKPTRMHLVAKIKGRLGVPAIEAGFIAEEWLRRTFA